MKQPNTDTEVFAEALATTPTAKAAAPSIAPGEIIIGVVTAIDLQGQPLVNYSANPAAHPLAAMSTLGITAAHIGRNVALLFANGDPQRPVIMGLIHSALHDLILAYDSQAHAQHNGEHTDDDVSPSVVTAEDITVDGNRVVLEGKEEVVLRCGGASITLTKDGEILIHGKHLLNRATGMNRIMGGTVRVN